MSIKIFNKKMLEVLKKKIKRRFIHELFELKRTINLNSYRNLFLSKQVNLPENLLYDNNTNAFIVIFSKDRAMQLHALIESYFRKVENLKEINILYTCSSNEHFKSYNELILFYNTNSKIKFIKETNFRKNLIQLIANKNCNKIILGGDDAIFSKSLNLNDFCSINPKFAIGSLYRGLDLNFCFAFDKEQPLPKLYNFSDDKFFNDKLIWKWDEAPESPDWAYPVALGFHLFDKEEILFMLKNTYFKAPNSLEGNLQAWLPYFIHRFGISYKNTVISSTPLNLVNTEVINNISNGHTVDELLEKWNEGYRIKYEDYDELNAIEATNHNIVFTKRKQFE